MISDWLIYLIILAVGGLICFRGLSLYKLVQFLICGWAGASLAWWILGKLPLELETSVTTLIGLAVGLLAGFLGFHFYKVGLFITAQISSFLVVFSFFWRQAMELGRTLLEQIGEVEAVFSVSNFFHTMLTEPKEKSDLGILDLMLMNAGIQPEIWSTELDQIMSLIRQGVLWAGIAGLVCGMLALTLGDYVIITVTALFGGMLLNLLVELIVPVSHQISTLLLCGFAILGFVMQLKRKRAG